MSYITDYPHTKGFDTDLTFLIDEYKRLNGSYDTLVKIYELIQNDIKNITLEQLQKWLDDGTIDEIILQALNGLTKVKVVNELPTQLENDYLYFNKLDSIESIKFKDSFFKLINEINKSNTLTIASYNFQSAGNIIANKLNQPIYDQLGIYTMLENKCDIVGCQEIAINNTFKIDTRFKNDIYKYNQFGLADSTITNENLFDREYGNLLLSKFEIKNKINKNFAFSGFEDRSISNCKITYNNKIISIYNTHLALETANRKTMIIELKNLLNADKTLYKIVIGDWNFNTKDTTEVNEIINLGYHFLNSTINTFPSNAPNSIVDNILVSNNINKVIDGVSIENKASDHLLYWATITLN